MIRHHDWPYPSAALPKGFLWPLIRKNHRLWVQTSAVMHVSSWGRGTVREVKLHLQQQRKVAPVQTNHTGYIQWWGMKHILDTSFSPDFEIIAAPLFRIFGELVISLCNELSSLGSGLSVVRDDLLIKLSRVKLKRAASAILPICQIKARIRTQTRAI